MTAPYQTEMAGRGDSFPAFPPQGEWWWPEGLVPEPDQFSDFAADIELLQPAVVAWIALTCGSWYSLWVNGALVSHGPPREVAPWQYYDTADLTACLTTGPNRLRIRAYHLGVDTQSHAVCLAGLMVAGEIAGTDWRINLGCRSHWRAARSPAFLRGAPRLFACLGFGEHADLRENTEDWLSRPADASWSAPAVVAQHPLPGHEQLIPGDLPSFSGETKEAVFLHETEAWQVWDFGGVVFGFLELRVEAGQPGSCTVLHGESLERDGLPDHKFCGGDFREILELPAGIRDWKAFEKRALRYLALPRGFLVHRLAIRESHWPLGEIWRETPGVDQLPARDRAIIAAAARTVVLCCDDLLNDCPRRERAQYADPADYMEVLPLLFGTAAPIRRWLRQYLRGARPDGVLRMCYPSPPDKPVIPDFSIGFAASLLRYLRLSGDTDTARACYPSAIAGLEFFERHADANGLLADVPGWTFLCNSFELAKHPRSAALNALWADGWDSLAELARELGKAGGERCRLKACSLREAWRNAFWRDGRILDSDPDPDRERLVWWNHHFDAARGDFTAPPEGEASFVLGFPIHGPASKLTLAAPGRIRVWCDGRLLLDATNSRPWTHPHPFHPWTCPLPDGAAHLLIEVGHNPVDWEVYVAMDHGQPGPAMAGRISRGFQASAATIGAIATSPAELRLWSVPLFNQITAGYCAGMLEPEEAVRVLRSCLREHYHVPWLKRTTPLICTPTGNPGLIANRVVPCNTPHSLSYFCRQLANHGLNKEARELCRRFFGPMVDAGSTTLWEEFAPRSSLCHAWGAFCVGYLIPASPSPV